MKFVFLKAVFIKIKILWDMMSCRLIKSDWWFDKFATSSKVLSNTRSVIFSNPSYYLPVDREPRSIKLESLNRILSEINGALIDTKRTFSEPKRTFSRSQWPLTCWECGVESPGDMDVSCECCVLSGRSLCDELIIRPEVSYRLRCVI